MGGGCGPNCTTFTLNVPLSSLSDEELESIRQSIIVLLQQLGAGRVTVSFREGSTKADASTENPVNDEALAAKVTKAGAIQPLGDSNFIIADINGKAMEYNNKLIIVKTDNTIAYIDEGDEEVVLRSDWNNATSGIEKDEIKHVTFGKNVKSLGRFGLDEALNSEVFAECNKLETVTLSPETQSIIGSVFTNCTSIKSFYITKNIGTIAIDIGWHSEGTTRVFGGCTSLESYDVDEENQTFSSVDGVLFKEKTRLEAFPLGNPKTEYTVPDGVTDIFTRAFESASLTSITLPLGLRSIQALAFANCAALTSINIPKSVNSLESSSIGRNFENCVALATVTFEDGRDEDLLLFNSVFKGCVALAAIDLPKKVLFSIEGDDAHEVARSVFEGCTSLVEVTVRDPRVEEYLDSTFKDVPAVQDGSLDFNVANTLPSVEFGANNGAFSRLSTVEGGPLNKLYFGAPDSGGDGLKKVFFLSDPVIKYFQLNVPLSSLNNTEQDSIKVSVGDLLSTLGGGAVTVEILPDPDAVGLTLVKATTTNEVDTTALAEKITKAGEIQTLGDSNFIIAKINRTSLEYNNKLIIVKNDNTIAYIDEGDEEIVVRSDWDNATSGITEDEIKHVTFGKNVKVIGSAEPGVYGEDTFKDCINIITVTFNEKLEVIRGGVFINCTSLLSFNITTNLNNISNFTFDPGRNDRLSPAYVLDGCISLTDIEVDKNNATFFYSDEGLLFWSEFSELLLYPSGNPRVEYILPTQIRFIDSRAFSKTQNLNNVKLHQEFYDLNWEAFKDSSIVSINIPNNLRFGRGENNAFGGHFENCSRLISIIFEGGETTRPSAQKTGIPKRLFKNCVELKSIDIPARFLFVIDNPQENSTNVFEGCTSLKKITIRNPDMVEYLDDTFKDVPAVQDGSLDFNVANALREIEFGANNGAFSNKSTELDPPNKLYFGDDNSGGVGVKKVLLTPPS